MHHRRPRSGKLGQHKWWRKFSRTGERAPGMLLLTNQFHDLFECFSVIVCAQSEASIYRAAFVIFLYEGVYLQTRPPLPIWLVQENYLREVFSVKVSPKSLPYQFHSILFYQWGETFNNVLKGEKNSDHFSCTRLTSMLGRRKQPRGRFRMNKPRSTLVFTNLFSISPQSDFFNWYIFLFLFLLTC